MDNGSQALIRLDNVSKVFVTDEVETHALSGIHFEVKKGEYLSIAGPSGCGKSTLLAILGLLDTPSDGTYYQIAQDIKNLVAKDGVDVQVTSPKGSIENIQLLADFEPRFLARV